MADCERAARFYCGVLGLPELRRNLDADGSLRSIWLAAGDAVLMLERSLRGAPGQDGSGHLLAFAVDALAPWEALLQQAGIAIDDRTLSTLYLRDPDGHRVGLSCYPLAPAR